MIPQMLLPAGSVGHPVSATTLAILGACGACIVVYAWIMSREGNR